MAIARGLRAALGVCGVLYVLPAAAAEAPTGPGDAGDLQQLVDELKAQIEKAEQERLADPWFLRELEALADRYYWPWRSRVYAEGFNAETDGLPQPWRALSGDVRYRAGDGLRTVMRPAAPAASAEQPAASAEREKPSTEQAVRDLMGAFLDEAMRSPQEKAQPEEPAEAEPSPEAEPADLAAAAAPVEIPNAFAMEIRLLIRPLDAAGDRRLEFGAYRGEGAEAGYRLVYAPRAAQGEGMLRLVRRSSRGTEAMLALHDREAPLSDDQSHNILWTRDQRGRMSVHLNGEQVLQAVDRGLSGAFDGVVMLNRGGDYTLRRLVIRGP